MAVICASCGQENPDGFRFCGRCGGELDDAPRRQTRKTVTVLFADVVGSTALGETRDPESMRKEMGEWFAAARAILERHGGRGEKVARDAAQAGVRDAPVCEGRARPPGPSARQRAA